MNSNEREGIEREVGGERNQGRGRSEREREQLELAKIGEIDPPCCLIYSHPFSHYLGRPPTNLKQ